jgi:hypothetical protein
MQDKMKSLHENHTYDLVEQPKVKRALKNKWVFRCKIEPNRSQPRYKARLVVKGFDQKKGINFDEIFSLVVKMSSIRVVSGLLAKMNLKIEQLDVKTAFLHGDLEEKIYMEQPEVCGVSPGSWIAGGAGGGVRCCRRLMEKSRSRFKTIFLETSIYPAGRGTEGMIHDGEEGEMQLMIFKGQIRSRASPREIGILSNGEKTSKKESRKL